MCPQDRLFAVCCLAWIVIQTGCASRTATEVSGASQSASLVVTPDRLVVSRDSLDDPPQRRVTFELSNDGPDVMRIETISASCGCTVIDQLKSNVLNPGEHVELTAMVDLPRYGSKQSVVTVRAQSQGDDPSARSLRIPIILNGLDRPLPWIEIQPKELTMTTTNPAESLRRDFVVSTHEAHEPTSAWLTGYASSDDRVRLTSFKMTTEQRGELYVYREYTGTVEAHGIGAAGFHGAWLTPIVQASPAEPPPRIWVSPKYSPPLAVYPQALSVPTEASVDQASRNIVVKSGDGSAFALASVSDEQGVLDIQFTPGVSRRLHTLQVRLRDNIDLAGLQSRITTIKIATDHATCPDLFATARLSQ
jgi:hypothetical protein